MMYAIYECSKVDTSEDNYGQGLSFFPNNNLGRTCNEKANLKMCRNTLMYKNTLSVKTTTPVKFVEYKSSI